MVARILKALIYFGAVAVVVFAAAEIFQRRIEPSPTAFFMFPPNTEREIRIDPAVVKGVALVGHFVVNGYGLRGRAPANEKHRVLVLGASSVEQILQDEPNVWTAQLDRLTSASEATPTIWFGNAGRSGLTSFEHIIQMRHLPDMIPEVNKAILMVGGTDLAYGIRNANRPQPETVSEQTRYERTFWTIRRPDGFLDNFALYRLYESVKRVSTLESRGVMQVGGTGRAYMVWLRNGRAARQAMRPHRDDIPDLTPYLDVFRRNLETIIDLARNRNIEIALMTQPLMFRANQSEIEEKTYGSFGQVTDDDNKVRFFYSSSAMERMKITYDQVILEVCQRRQISCIDAASKLAPTVDNYYDGVHLTDSGNLALAHMVHAELKGTLRLQ